MKFVAQINEEIFYLTSVVRLLLRELYGLKREGGTVYRQKPLSAHRAQDPKGIFR